MQFIRAQTPPRAPEGSRAGDAPIREINDSSQTITREILGLDMRFLAALMVLAYHMCFWRFRGEEQVLRVMLGSTHIAELPETSTDFGWVGVEIFFVISGLVIAYSAERAAAFSFFRGRFLRLMPCVWFACSLCLPVAVFIEKRPAAYVGKLFLKSIFLYPRGPWIEGVLWMLIVEAAFYTVVFLLIMKRWFKHIDQVGGCVGLLSASYWIFQGSMLRSPRFGWLANQMGDWSWSPALQLSLVHYGCFFGLGIGLWLLLIKRGIGLTTLMAPVMLLGCYFEIVYVSELNFDKTRVPQNSLVPFAVWLASMVFLVVSVAQNARIAQYCSALGANMPTAIQWFGRMTYPLYLLHVPAILLAISCAPVSIGPTLRWSCGLIAALATAALFTAYVEPRLKEFLRHAFDKLQSYRHKRT